MKKQQIVFGTHAVTSLLTHQIETVTELWIVQGKEKRLEQIIIMAEVADIPIQLVKASTIEKLADGGNHQGVLAKVKPAKELNEHDLLNAIDANVNPLFLVLDGVTDPHNLGACIRSAEAAGVIGVIVPKDKSASINSTVRKVACGAAEVMPFYSVTNLARTLKAMQEKGIWIHGAAGEATHTIYQANFTGATAIVMGAEEKGLRRLTRECCDGLISIPMQGEVSSLNVSAATAVCLFEALRQRLG